MSTALVMFLGFVAVTLVITYWAARRSQGAEAFSRRAARSQAGRTGWPWRATT
jgi:hypothetical protein